NLAAPGANYQTTSRAHNRTQATRCHMRAALGRVVRFLRVSAWDVAWDLLVPSVVAVPLKLAQNFYACFLTAEPAVQRELLVAAVALSPDQLAVGKLHTTCLLGAPRPGGKAGDDAVPANAPQIPGYQLVRRLGQGGFATVYLALHLATGDRRAIKIGPLTDRR